VTVKLYSIAESHPARAAELAMRIAPDFGDSLPIELPPEWVPQPAGHRT
jgi:hypothetical protein